MSIGEPQHAPPQFVLETLKRTSMSSDSYPATAGTAPLRAACAAWVTRRFGLRKAASTPTPWCCP